MSDLRYGFERRFDELSFEAAIDRVTAALQGEGFGVLTRIDVHDTLKKKLGVDFRRYAILGACHPRLAHAALSVEPHIGLLLPCNVVIQEQEPPEGGVVVSFAAPDAMFALVDNPAVQPVVDEAGRRLRRVLEALKR